MGSAIFLSGLGTPGWPALNGFCCLTFLSPTGLWLLRISLAHLQICRNGTLRVPLPKKTYSFYSSHFIYQLGMFWHMLYFAFGQRWHLNAEDSCPCFCFPCTLTPTSVTLGCEGGDILCEMLNSLGCENQFWCIFLLFPAPDGPPQDVQLEPISSQSIRVTWKVNTHPWTR